MMPSMNRPTAILCIIPSRLAVGEEFSVKVRVQSEPWPVKCRGQWNTVKPGQGSPFNVNVEREIQFMDNTLPEFKGKLLLESDALEGSAELEFDGVNQGIFPGDRRPIKTFHGFRWTKPGFQFIKLIEPESGTETSSNAVFVSATAPATRIYWGDPHWQTFFSDGIRCPEELFAFARDQAFLAQRIG